MKTKIGLTTKDITLFADYLQNDFKQITRAGVNYNYLLAFEEHITNDFEIQFETIEAYEEWLTDFIYIIIPVELTPKLEAMTELVEDIVFDDIFNVILSKKEFETRNGKKGNIPTFIVPFVTCKVAKWEEGDDERLQAIIDQFNALYNPPLKIDFTCKFDSLQDLESFKQIYCYI